MEYSIPCKTLKKFHSLIYTFMNTLSYDLCVCLYVYTYKYKYMYIYTWKEKENVQISQPFLIACGKIYKQKVPNLYHMNDIII